MKGALKILSKVKSLVVDGSEVKGNGLSSFTVTDIDALKAALIVSIHAAAEVEEEGKTFYPVINGTGVAFDRDWQLRVANLLDELVEA